MDLNAEEEPLSPVNGGRRRRRKEEKVFSTPAEGEVEAELAEMNPSSWSSPNDSIIASNLQVLTEQPSSKSSSDLESKASSNVTFPDDSFETDLLNDANMSSALNMTKEGSLEERLPSTPRHTRRRVKAKCEKNGFSGSSQDSDSPPKKSISHESKANSSHLSRSDGKRKYKISDMFQNDSPCKSPGPLECAVAVSDLSVGKTPPRRSPRKRAGTSKLSDNFQVSPSGSPVELSFSDDTASKSNLKNKGKINLANRIFNFGLPDVGHEEEEDEYRSIIGSIATVEASKRDEADEFSSFNANKSSSSTHAAKSTPKKIERRSPTKRTANDGDNRAKPDVVGGEKAKASSVFNADELMDEEYRQIREGAPAKTDKLARRRYLDQCRKVFKQVKGKNAAAAAANPSKAGKKVSPTKRKRTNGDAADFQELKRSKQQTDKRQRSMTDFFSPSRLSSSCASDESEDEKDDVGWEKYILKIDEVVATQDLADETTTMDEYFQMIKARSEALRMKEEEEEKSKSVQEKQENDRRIIREENERLREKLDKELDEQNTRKLVRDNFDFIQNVWDGRVESSRYSAFQRGGQTRNALLYCMITSPFSDAQVDWVMDEITSKWMPTRSDQIKHSDFVWKVILAETLIKIYMDLFKFDKAEAERRMGNTPARPEESA